MKKIGSVCLALLMLLSCFAVPTTAFAASPMKPVVSSVSAGAAAFTVKWKRVSGVSGYQVQYSTSSKFTSKTSKSVKVKKGTTVSKTITGLNSKSKYYVRVRTYKTNGKKTQYSAWSGAKSVTTKVAGVSLKSVTAQRLGFTATWGKAPAVSGYRVQYSTTSKFDKGNTKSLKITNGKTTSATITGLAGGKKYFVRVQAYVNKGGKAYSGAYCAAKTVTTAKDPFHKGSYAGVQLNSTADAVRYYVKAYNATKKETANYADKDKNVYTFYKMLGLKEINVTNVRLEGKRNTMIENLVQNELAGTEDSCGLPPCTSVSKSEDTDLNGRSLVTSRLRDADVESLQIKDNHNGTITLTIKPKAVQMSSPGADAQGRFFSTMGPLYDAIDSSLQQTGAKWSSGNAKKNVRMNYSGGTGTITINTSTGKITKARYKMVVKTEVRNVQVNNVKINSLAMTISTTDTFPISADNLEAFGVARV